jgi:hypothetical protein
MVRKATKCQAIWDPDNCPRRNLMDLVSTHGVLEDSQGSLPTPSLWEERGGYQYRLSSERGRELWKDVMDRRKG